MYYLGDENKFINQAQFHYLVTLTQLRLIE